MDMSDVTRLLHQIQDGDTAATEELLPLVYDELRKLAAAKMTGERLDHTLPPTALVHEAYLGLVVSGDDGSDQWEGRGLFLLLPPRRCGESWWHARNRGRLKRGGDVQRRSLDSIDFSWNPKYGDILDLNEAFNRELAPFPFEKAGLSVDKSVQ